MLRWLIQEPSFDGGRWYGAYDGNQSGLTEEQWGELGFNNSTIHTDIVSTTDRTVTAALSDGSERVIYASGQFQMN